jgi:hypothetical protein
VLPELGKEILAGTPHLPELLPFRQHDSPRQRRPQTQNNDNDLALKVCHIKGIQ